MHLIYNSLTNSVKLGGHIMDYKEIIESKKEQFEDVEVSTLDAAIMKFKDAGYNVIFDTAEKPNYIPKTRFDEVIAQKNEFKTQAGELTSKLEELGKSAQGNDELTKKIEELQNDNAKHISDWETKYKASQIENAINMAATKANANDASDIQHMININAVEFSEDGNIKGLDDQIALLVENKPYLFANKQQTQKGLNPGKGNTNQSAQ